MRKGSKHSQKAIEANKIAHKGKRVWNKGLKGPEYKKHFGNGFGGTFSDGHIPWHKGRKNVYSKESLKKLSQSHIGKLKAEKNPRWKGGITPINKAIRASIEYKLWRRAVMERDNFTCRFCATIGGKLQVDHIKPFALYPELRFAIDNGRTLCKPCHLKTDTWGNRINKI